MRVGIIGGGVAGLAAAYDLVQGGHQVSLFEAAPFLGGQASTIEIDSGRLERFYHHIFVSDSDILQLLGELGLAEQLRWVDSRVGILQQGKVYNFVTPLDLLRFSPLSLVNRVRLGLVSLYLQRQTNWQRYERVKAKDWIRRYAGSEVYDKVWGPLLQGKFGDAAEEVGLVWFWGKLHLRFASRGRGMAREKLGYLLGSFGLMIDALEERIRKGGGQIYVGSKVERVIATDGRAVGLEVASADTSSGAPAGRHDCEAVIATTPSYVLRRLAPDLAPDYQDKLAASRYLAAVTTILVLSHPLTHIYWMNVGDRSFPFVALIEHTNLIEPAHYGGQSILYISNYVDREHELYRMDAEDLVQLYLPHLRRINPAFRKDWVRSWTVHKEDAAQPLVTTDYSARIPSHETPLRGLYLANTSQIYPEDRGMNYSIRLGRRVAALAAGSA